MTKTAPPFLKGLFKVALVGVSVTLMGFAGQTPEHCGITKFINIVVLIPALTALCGAACWKLMGSLFGWQMSARYMSSEEADGSNGFAVVALVAVLLVFLPPVVLAPCSITLTGI